MKRTPVKASKSISHAGSVKNATIRATAGKSSLTAKASAKTRQARKEGRNVVSLFLRFPGAGIISYSFDRDHNQKAFISIVNRLMGFMDGCNQILRIQQNIISLPNVLRPDWVHMVDQDPAKYLSPRNSQIAASISGDDNVPHLPPLWGAIKELVHMPVKSKGLLANYSAKL